MRGIAILAAAAALFTAQDAFAAGNAEAPKSVDWAHEGLFGTYDRAAAQRGMQVYREVCSGCHGLNYIAFRNLTEIGLTEDQAKVVAAEYTIVDGPNDEGEMFERPGKLSDYFPAPFENEKAARAANSGAMPPDLSLIVKARPGFENYLYSLLTGYGEPPENVELMEGMFYNPYFPGHQIAMGEPLGEDAVEYADGTKATAEQIATDVTTFLAWAAEPELEERKRLGIKVLLFLIVLTAMLYALKRQIWKDLH